MEISIDQTELEQAIKNYVKDQGISVRGKELTVDITMTRNPTAYRASVSISGVGTPADTRDTAEEPPWDAGLKGDGRAVTKETPVPTPEVKPEPELPQDDGNTMEKGFKLGSKKVEAAVEEVAEIVDTAAKQEVKETVTAGDTPADDVEDLFK